MTLGEQQRLFTKLSAQLILWAYENGYELTYGDAYRTPAQAAANAQSGAGISNSLHTQRLAIDLNLFLDGDGDGDQDYQTDTAAYKPLGDYWKSLHPLCCWGGDFKPPAKPDGNHFSMTFGGVK